MPTTARELLNAVKQYAARNNLDPETAMRALPDEQFKMLVWSTAELFKTLREEAKRRGIWEELSSSSSRRS